MILLIALFFILLIALNIFSKEIFSPTSNEDIFKQPFKQEHKKILLQWIPFYKGLNQKGRIKFENRIKYFWTKINIESKYEPIDDTCRLLVACSAVIPFWGLPLWNYGRLKTVIIYPDNFDWDFQVGRTKPIQGLVGISGALDRYMILSKPALYRGFKHPKNEKNVGFHEFAHLLDKEDGVVDGIPSFFLPKEKINEWNKLVYREMARMKRNRSDINNYGLTNKAEFFSVVTEYFFEDPKQMKQKYPELYRMLKLIYKNDTASNKSFH